MAARDLAPAVRDPSRRWFAIGSARSNVAMNLRM